MNTQSISIIVPVLNEENNISLLVKRIAASLASYEYEIIFVDDHSTDRTKRTIHHVAKQYPISLKREMRESTITYRRVFIRGISDSLHD